MGIGENISQKWKTNYCLGRKILLNKVQNGLRKFFKKIDFIPGQRTMLPRCLNQRIPGALIKIDRVTKNKDDLIPRSKTRSGSKFSPKS